MEKTGGCGVGGCGASRPRKLEWFGAIGGVRTSNMSVRLLVCPRSRVMETHTPSSSASKFLMTRDPDARTASTSALASRRSVAMAHLKTRDTSNLRSTPLPRGRSRGAAAYAPSAIQRARNESSRASSPVSRSSPALDVVGGTTGPHPRAQSETPRPSRSAPEKITFEI